VSYDVRHLASTNPYRMATRELYTEVLNCPNYGKECAPDLKPGYRPGPEMSFIGSQYGQSGRPRILFTRVAPNWNERAKSFGTRESLYVMMQADPPRSLDRVFDCLRDYWIDNKTQTLFQGCNCWNTVAGKGNFPIDSFKEYFSRAIAYGIKMILGRMQEAGILSSDLEDVLDCCAINNLVKCSGKAEAGNPTPAMQRCCLQFFKREIHVLRPEIVVTFGKADMPPTMLDGVRFIEKLPHPAFRPGPWNRQHPPGPGISWGHECERKQYRGCLALKALLDSMVGRMAQAIR
jgi:hypothetical protein